MFSIFALSIILLSSNSISQIVESKTLSQAHNNHGQEKYVCNRTQWELYKRNYTKKYDSEDEARFSNFCRNLKTIEDHNANSHNSSYKMAVNQFTDWTGQELSAYSNFRTSSLLNEPDFMIMNLPNESKRLHDASDDDLPAHFDWSENHQIVSPVRAQGNCGSCWAFATIGLIEGQQRPKMGETLTQLSEQNLIDCNETGDGCDGGEAASALVDVKLLGGLMSLTDYPYVSNITLKRQDCQMDKSKIVPYTSKLGDIKRLPHGEEDLLKRKLYEYGPIMIQYHTTQSFYSYSEGVFEKLNCPIWGNHMMLLVGYGTDSSGQDYWKVKNSWSDKWGINGYGLVARNKDNNCGVATKPFIVTTNW